MAYNTASHSVHVTGVPKGEEWVIHKGREPGRGVGTHYQNERDSTGINPRARGPIDPRMPHLPPA